MLAHMEDSNGAPARKGSRVSWVSWLALAALVVLVGAIAVPMYGD